MTAAAGVYPASIRRISQAVNHLCRLFAGHVQRGQAVLVVGGGDSALEAAIALSEQPGTDVRLSYRSAAFSRVKQKNRLLLEQQQQAGRLKVMMNSSVKTISEQNVEIETEGQTERCPNDVVIVCAGGLLPTPLLQKAGIRFETKFGTA